MAKIVYRAKLNDNTDLLADVYLSSQTEAKGNLIFLAGLPSYMHKSNFAECVSDYGYNVIQPFYYGSWVSGGDFTVENCFQTVYDTIEGIKDNKVLDLYSLKSLDLKTDNISLAGLSFGTNIIQSLPDHNSIEKVVLISTVPTFSEQGNDSFGFNADHFTGFIQRGFSRVYKSSDWEQWRREFTGKGKYLNTVSSTLNCPFLVIHGEKDGIKPEVIKEHLQKNIAYYRFEVLPDAGHHLNTMNENQLANIVYDFLEE